MKARLFVLEFFNAESGWSWFWGYPTLAEAQADRKKYAAESVGGHPRRARVTQWARVGA